VTAQGEERRGLAAALARDHDGVVSRTSLRGVGVDRWAVAAEARAGRWATHGRQTIAVHTGPLSAVAQRWRAVWEVGRGAVLDGVAALEAAGLESFEIDDVHVSIDHEQGATRVAGVRVHQVREVREVDSTAAGVPRVRPSVAAVRAAQWAASDRQAALLVCMAVQQRLVRPGDLCPVRWPGAHYGRTGYVRQLLEDVKDGAHSLGELDFARLCRLRDLPEPARQVVRQGPRGRVYLDVRWRECPLVVEVDGAQHRLGLAVSADNLRRNDLAIGGETVLTIDLVGLRLMTDEFLDQVATGIRLLTSPSSARLGVPA
jgi:very-short-patch-repair endonuclease